MNPLDDLGPPDDPETSELFDLLAAYREAYLGRRAFPSVKHLGPAIAAAGIGCAALTFAMDMAGEAIASSSTLPAVDSDPPGSADFATPSPTASNPRSSTRSWSKWASGRSSGAT